MGLNIHRTVKSPAYSSDSSTLMSARYEYRLAINKVSSKEMNVEVRDFANQNHELDDEGAKRLFDHIWKQVTANRQLNVVINLSEIQSVTPRFERELGYLRRQLRPQGRSARLSNISANCEQARSLEIA